MNTLMSTTPPGGGKPVVMSSREIAELTGKRHPDVKRDIEKLLSDLGEDVSKFAHIYLDSMNREQTEYLLDRDHTENLLMGYSPVLRRAVLARMREMEAMLSGTHIPTTAEAFAHVFRMVADAEREREQQNTFNAQIVERVEMVEQTAPLKAKPQNAETRSEVRKRMNRLHGLSEPIIDTVLDHVGYGIRPFAMVKNSHEEAQGSSYGVYWIRDISALFKKFVSECTPHSATLVRHPIISRPFKLTRKVGDE